MSTGIRECPFCGETESVTVVVRKGKNGWRDRYCVRCDYDYGGCGAESGWCHSEGEAITSWNIRSFGWREGYVTPRLSVSGLWYECPMCHRHLTKDADNYCGRCGVELYWKTKDGKCNSDA